MMNDASPFKRSKLVSRMAICAGICVLGTSAAFGATIRVSSGGASGGVARATTASSGSVSRTTPIRASSLAPQRRLSVGQYLDGKSNQVTGNTGSGSSIKLPGTSGGSGPIAPGDYASRADLDALQSIVDALQNDIDAIDLTNYYTISQTDSFLGGKQDTLVAGANITITDGVISASGGGGGGMRDIEIRSFGGYIQWKYSDEVLWNNIVDLTTLKGDTGDQGLPGTQGDPGAAGLDGLSVELQLDGDYVQWRQVGGIWENLFSISSLQGIAGVDGASAYDLAVADGFVGTVGQWLASLQGADGAAGPTGSVGPAGLSAYEMAVADGFVGNEAAWLASLIGAAGPTGPQGNPGDPGPVGPTGPQGDVGPMGPAGAGLSILGELPNAGSLPGTGNAGDAYLINGDLYVWNGSNWSNVGNIQGPIGPEGPQGLQGLQGDTGPAGAPGTDGASAYQVAVAGGFAGTEAEWLASLRGTDGAPGADGAQGTAGTPGADGRAVTFQKTATHIQWQYVGDGTWSDLVLLSDLQGAAGADGRDVVMRVDGGTLQYQSTGDENWTNLITLSTLFAEYSTTAEMTAAIQTAIAAAVTQADWNQTEPTAPNYIQNKPVLGTAATTDAAAYATAAQGGLADTALQAETDPTVAPQVSDLTSGNGDYVLGYGLQGGTVVKKWIKVVE